MRLVLYTGKGGVGKTTTAAATAAVAAARGRRTLVASADAAHSLGDVLGERLAAAPKQLAPNLDAVEIDARVEIHRRWGRIHEFLVELFAYHGIDAVVAEELALLPGAEEITTLLAVEELASSGAYDFVVVDCAPTDSALRLVTLPDVAHRFVRLALPLVAALSGIATPVARRFVSMPLPDSQVFRDANALLFRHLAALRTRLCDPGTSVRLVVTSERMVIDEARRAYTDLSLFDVGCDAVIVNRLLPDSAAAEAFFSEWVRVQAERVAEIHRVFAPLPILTAPLGDDEVTGLGPLAQHGAKIFGSLEPDATLCTAPRVRFRRDGPRYIALVPLPGADPAHLDVVKVDGELTITTDTRRRSLTLPRRFAPLVLESARLEGTTMRVAFVRAPAGEAL